MVKFQYLSRYSVIETRITNDANDDFREQAREMLMSIIGNIGQPIFFFRNIL